MSRSYVLVMFDIFAARLRPSKRPTYFPSSTVAVGQASVAESDCAPACERGALMITYQPKTPHSDSIKRPDCAKCGTKTRLFGIEPERPGHELHSFVRVPGVPSHPSCNLRSPIGRCRLHRAYSLMCTQPSIHDCQGTRADNSADASKGRHDLRRKLARR
jgi:hypothetical protein